MVPFNGTPPVIVALRSGDIDAAIDGAQDHILTSMLKRSDVAAYTIANDARALGLVNVSVVQGTQMGGPGELAGVRFGHSWVEANVAGQTGRVAIDYSSGNTLVMDRDTYRFQRQARDVHEYRVNEATAARTRSALPDTGVPSRPTTVSSRPMRTW